ncbi:MAG: HAD-IIB family hydrolase, partial [Marinobacter alexandrii]
MTKPKLLIISDLDGTLLNHENYRWDDAAPALKRLDQSGIPLILNSSKTAPEIRKVRQELGNGAPFIVENGAAVVIPADTFGNGEEQVVNFGASRADVLKVLTAQRQAGAR